MPEIYPYGRDAPEGTYFAERRGGFDRGAGGPGEEWDPGSANNSASASAAAELARMWASAGVGIEPSPTNYPGMFSAFHYATIAQQLIQDAFPPGPGTNGYVLTADDTEPSGVKWASNLATTWGFITGNLSDQPDLQAALDAKVAKSGDTMSGPLIFPDGFTQIKNDTTDVTMVVQAGTGFGTGAALYLEGAGVDGLSVPGRVRLRADDGVDNSTLELLPDGTLTLDGSPVGGGGGGGGTWGSITGTLADQTDLQDELDDKAPVVHTHDGIKFTYGNTFPTVGNTPGDRFFNEETGKEYTWVDDGTSEQWVELLVSEGGGGGSSIPLPLAIGSGGTGSTTATDALTALLPSQTGNNGKVLGTNGSVTSWVTAGGSDLATDTLWDAKGDIVAGSGANAAGRLPVGTNGQVLTADSAEALGVKWADAPAISSGTFTPNLFVDGAPSTVNVHNGVYYKIGKLVYITCHFALLTKASGTGIVYITGFPFAAAASPSSAHRGAVIVNAISSHNSTHDGLASINMEPGATYGTLAKVVGGATVAFTGSDINNNTAMQYSGVYMTD